MGAELEISATDFKAKCLNLFDRLAARKLTRVIVTKHGRPVAQLIPPPSAAEEVEQMFGAMRDQIVAPADYDFTAPVIDEPLNAAEGRLHE
jgi:prevent-host-death family protein